MDKMIAVGFGSATLERDGEVMLDGEAMSQDAESWDDVPTFTTAEHLAASDPDHDWRVVLHGPLHGETYQRHGPEEWVLVETNEGFA